MSRKQLPYSRKQKNKLGKGKWLILLFQLLSLSLVLLLTIHRLNIRIAIFCGFLLIFTLFSNFFVDYLKQSEKYLILIANMLISIGVIMIYRISPSLGERQLLFYGIGLTLFFLCYYFLKYTYHIWEKHDFLFYGISVALLAVTLAFGITMGGATNWLSIGGFQFQPSEFAKLSFVFFIAGYYTNFLKDKKESLESYPLMVLSYILIGLFFLQRELGTAAVFMGVLFSAQLVFDKRKWPLLVNILLSVVGLFIAYKLFGHVKLRFEIWRDPWADIDGAGYQIAQSLFAIAGGGFFGRGIGLGSPGTIPLAESDFIFAAIIEEMGIFMGIAIVLLYLILFYRGIKIAMNQHHPFYRVVALCTSMLFVAQAFIVIGGVLKIIPLTGITLPFIAYGGSSITISFLLLGVLQFCSEDISVEEVNLLE